MNKKVIVVLFYVIFIVSVLSACSSEKTETGNVVIQTVVVTATDDNWEMDPALTPTPISWEPDLPTVTPVVPSATAATVEASQSRHFIKETEFSKVCVGVKIEVTTTEVVITCTLSKSVQQGTEPQ